MWLGTREVSGQQLVGNPSFNEQRTGTGSRQQHVSELGSRSFSVKSYDGCSLERGQSQRTQLYCAQILTHSKREITNVFKTLNFNLLCSDG